MLRYGIPYWYETIEIVYEMAHLTPTLRYVGWNVAITEIDPELIEANHNAVIPFMVESALKNYSTIKIKNSEHPILPSRHDGGGSLHGVGGAGLGVDYHRAED